MINIKKILILAFVLFWTFSYSQKIDYIEKKRTDKICVFLSYGKKSEPWNLLNYLKKSEPLLHKRIKKATTSYELKIDSITYYCVYLGKNIMPYKKMESMINKPLRYSLVEFSYLFNDKREKVYLIDEK